MNTRRAQGGKRNHTNYFSENVQGKGRLEVLVINERKTYMI